jgi:hypothetical protein
MFDEPAYLAGIDKFLADHPAKGETKKPKSSD